MEWWEARGRCLCNETDLELAMSVRTKTSWSRRAVFTGAVLATAALTMGVMSRSAAAQYVYDYGYGYPGTVYSYSPYSYPSYYRRARQGQWVASVLRDNPEVS